jgi:hypothetical protein
MSRGQANTEPVNNKTVIAEPVQEQEQNATENQAAYAQLEVRYTADALSRGLSLKQIRTVLQKIRAMDLDAGRRYLDAIHQRSSRATEVRHYA